jgi:hypothetical protein
MEAERLSSREVAIREFNSLRGRLCSVIEGAGLEKTQERALVILVKNMSYQNQKVVAELLERQDDAIEQLGGEKLEYRYNHETLVET